MGASPATGRTAHTQVYLGHGYQERMSPRAHDPGYVEADTRGAKPFTEAEATGATAEVTFKKRPFGILRYAPGADAKNAMVMEIIPKSRYPGDPQGQAFAAGVKSGWIVKSINGEEVAGQAPPWVTRLQCQALTARLLTNLLCRAASQLGLHQTPHL